MQRRRFGREFEIEAVRLIRERGVSVAQASRDREIHENVLRKWMKEFAAGQVLTWDSDLRGFGLLTLPSGTKSFILQYRNAAGRSRRTTLGRYSALAVDEARVQVRAALVEASRRVDPMADKRAYRQSPTLNDLFDRYLEEHVSAHNAASTAKDVEPCFVLARALA